MCGCVVDKFISENFLFNLCIRTLVMVGGRVKRLKGSLDCSLSPTVNSLEEERVEELRVNQWAMAMLTLTSGMMMMITGTSRETLHPRPPVMMKLSTTFVC